VVVRGRAVATVAKMVDFANRVLAKYRFNENKYKIFVKRVKVLSFDDCSFGGVDYCASRSSLLDLLEAHSAANRDDFCLSYVLTAMEDAGGNLGKAFVANAESGENSNCSSRSSSLTAAAASTAAE
jgi:hypothetical protein